MAVEAQVSAARMLGVLEGKIRCQVNELGFPVRFQIKVATLVARMAEHDVVAQEEIARERERECVCD